MYAFMKFTYKDHFWSFRYLLNLSLFTTQQDNQQSIQKAKSQACHQWLCLGEASYTNVLLYNCLYLCSHIICQYVTMTKKKLGYVVALGFLQSHVRKLNNFRYQKDEESFYQILFWLALYFCPRQLCSSNDNKCTYDFHCSYLTVI